jgi:hypothetical protein
LLPRSTPPKASITPKEEARGNLTLIYPQTEGLGEKGERINQVIAQEIDTFANQHDLPQHSGQVGYKVEFNKNYFLSVKLRESFYVQNAAHPMSYQRTFTFNLRTGGLLQLSDLFLPGRDYAPKLNAFAKQQLAERHIALLRPYKGLSPTQEFYLTPDALIIYYQIYEYTAYVYGFLELTIPFDQLYGFIRPELTWP